MNLHEVGCRNCGQGGKWKIFTDGAGIFAAECECGHISNFEITDKPDMKAIQLHYLV